MRVSEGRVGRVFVVRLDDGDRLPGALEELAKEKEISAASVILLGGLRSGEVVVGPRTEALPPEPMTAELEGLHEIAGVGTLFCNEKGEPRLHLHAAMGRDGRTIVGCTREGVEVWLVAEAIITEIVGSTAHRVKEHGLELLEP